MKFKNLSAIKRLTGILAPGCSLANYLRQRAIFPAILLLHCGKRNTSVVNAEDKIS